MGISGNIVEIIDAMSRAKEETDYVPDQEHKWGLNNSKEDRPN